MTVNYLRLLLLTSAFQLIILQELKAQFEKDYTPIIFSGDIPKELLVDYSSQTQKDIASEKILDNKHSLKFYQELNCEKKKLFSNGYIYFNDPLTTYVRSVADKLLINNPDLKSKVNIYVTRYSSANAMALPDGSIFVNIGLLARLENEAQLAFILGHEIAHVELQHAVKGITKLLEIQSQEYNNYNPEGNLFRKLKYSREDEFEADSKGLTFVLSSGYDPMEAMQALRIINDTIYSHVTDIKQKIKDSFENESLKLDSAFFASKKTSTSNEKSDLVFNQSPDDLYQTHPEINKRIFAIKELLGLMEYQNEGKTKNIASDSTNAEKIKQISRFEILENLSRNTDYHISLFFSLALLKEFPDNKYLKLAVIKDLYWLNYYKEIESFNNVLNTNTIEQTESFKVLYNFLVTISHNDLKKIFYSYTKQHLEELKKDEDYYLYYGLATEAYLGKEPSKIIYNQYLLKFPDSKHILFVKNKIQ